MTGPIKIKQSTFQEAKWELGEIVMCKVNPRLE